MRINDWRVITVTVALFSVLVFILLVVVYDSGMSAGIRQGRQALMQQQWDAHHSGRECP